jgi:hypothetical protein
MQTRFSQRQEAPWRCSKSIRIGMAAATLLASLAGIAASPAAPEDEVRAPDPAAAQTTAAGSAEQAASPEEQVAVPEDQDAGSAEPAAHRPAPPPPLATWSGAFPIGRKRYTYVMVGTNPMVKRARNTVVPVAIVPMRFVFHDGTVLDPTQPDACLGGRVPLNVTLLSPLFQDFDYGDGPRQFLEHIQRMAFWQYTGPGKLNPSYSVRLGTPTILPTQTLTLAPDSSTEDYPCATTGGTQKYGHIEGVVGAPPEVVYIFVRQPAVGWVEQAAILAPPSEASPNFGFRVAISGDELLVGGPSLALSQRVGGSAFAYRRVGDAWRAAGTFFDSQDDFYGSRISLDGPLAAIAGNGPIDTYLFGEQGWVRQAPVAVAPDAKANSISLSGDVLVVGSFNDGVALWQFHRGAWALEAMVPIDSSSVVLSGDTLAVAVAATGESTCSVRLHLCKQTVQPALTLAPVEQLS